MRYFEAVINRVSLIGRDIGAVFLLTVMLIIVANIIYRLFGGIIPGTYDLVELLIVPAVAFALVTVELAKRHTIVDMIINYLPLRAKLWVEVAMTVVSIAFWGVVCYASYGMTLEKMKRGEVTDTLKVSVIPVRWIWACALAWLLVVIVMNIAKLAKAIVKVREAAERAGANA